VPVDLVALALKAGLALLVSLVVLPARLELERLEAICRHLWKVLSSPVA
jgi:hypothetical protein